MFGPNRINWNRRATVARRMNAHCFDGRNENSVWLEVKLEVRLDFTLESCRTRSQINCQTVC